MHEKLTKCPNFTRFLPEKIVFARIWGGGATALPDPPSPYAYDNNVTSSIVWHVRLTCVY